MTVLDSTMDGYIHAVREILCHPELFECFRRHPRYQWVVEHVDEGMGEDYLHDILEMDSKLFDVYKEHFRCSDIIGSPKLYDYGEHGRWSPTTLRYIHILFSILQVVPLPLNKKIVEFGVGYGGLCKIITSLILPKEYVFYDLPDVLKLAGRYLRANSVPDIWQGKTTELITKENADLFISTFAIAEVEKDLQEEIYEKLILSSNAGYIIYNNLGDDTRYTAYQFGDMLKRDFSTFDVEKDPYTPSLIFSWKEPK
jgi:putative sugar O-methyltransferase